MVKSVYDRVKEARASRNGHKPHGNPAEQASPPPSSPTPATFGAGDLMRMDLPEPRWAVDGIVPQGLSILAGKPKLGKSWLALHLGLAVSCGGVALGKIKVQGGSVLYLALEDTKRRLQSRIKKVLGPNEQPSNRLHLATAWPRMDKGGLDAIAEWVESHKDARLIIIDTWQKFRTIRTGKADSYEVDYADGSQVKLLADKYNIAIIIVHHCRKMAAADAIEEVSGSVGLTGACDGILVMRRERGQHDATLLVTGRDVEETELALSFDKTHCLWQLMGEADAYRMSNERMAVVNVLREAGRPLTPSEIAPLLQKPANTVKQLLWKMARDGHITVGSGSYSLRESDNLDNSSNRDNRDNRDNRPVTGSSSDDNRDDNRDDLLETPWG